MMVVDRDTLRRETEEAKAQMGKVRFLKKNATTHLRIVEFTDSGGVVRFHRRVVQHRDASGKKVVGLCRVQTVEQPCVFCKVNEQAQDEGGDPVFRRQTQYWVNGMDINESSPRMRLWALPATAWQPIADTVMSDEWADILEAKTGHPFMVTRSGSGLDTEYSATPGRKPYPVPAAALGEVVDPFDEVEDPGLEAQCRVANVELDDVFDDAELQEAGVAATAGEAAAPAPEPPMPQQWRVGGRITANLGEGEQFAGVITSVDEENQLVDVTFDDGDVSNDINFADLEVETEQPASGPLFQQGTPSPGEDCFGDAALFDPTDPECKDCDQFAECKAAIGAAAAPRRRPRKAAAAPKPAGKTPARKAAKKAAAPVAAKKPIKKTVERKAAPARKASARSAVDDIIGRGKPPGKAARR